MTPIRAKNHPWLNFELNYQSACCESVILSEVDLTYMMMGKELMCGRQDDVVLDNVFNDHKSM